MLLVSKGLTGYRPTLCSLFRSFGSPFAPCKRDCRRSHQGGKGACYTAGRGAGIAIQRLQMQEFVGAVARWSASIEVACGPGSKTSSHGADEWALARREITHQRVPPDGVWVAKLAEVLPPAGGPRKKSLLQGRPKKAQARSCHRPSASITTSSQTHHHIIATFRCRTGGTACRKLWRSADTDLEIQSVRFPSSSFSSRGGAHRYRCRLRPFAPIAPATPPG
jgi:hypothetical protein